MLWEKLCYCQMLQDIDFKYICNFLHLNKRFDLQYKVELMYIGASYLCNEYCEEEDKRKFEKYHSEHRHLIVDARTFKEDNKDFLKKSKRAWYGFSIKLQSMFKKIKKQIEFIENQAFNRLELQQIKSAINSDDKHLNNITVDIVQERYRNLRCKDIDSFMSLRKQQQNISHINIEREEDQFGEQIINQLKNTLKQICRDIEPKNDNYKHSQKRNIKQERGKQQDRDFRPRKNEPIKNRQEHQRFQNKQKIKERPERYDRQQNRNYQRRVPQGKALNQERPDRNEPINRGPKRDNGGTQEFRHRQQRNKDYNKNRKQLRQRDQQVDKYKAQEKPKRRDNQQIKPCPKLKISVLNDECKAFDIELKLQTFLKSLNNKQVWRAKDQTGEIKVVVSSHSLLKQNAKITLHNCYARFYGQTLQVHTKHASKISGLEIKEQNFKYVSEPRNKYPKGAQKLTSQQKGLTKIKDIDPDSQGIKFLAKVVKVQQVNKTERIYRCVLGDETGIVDAQLKGFEQFLKEGKDIYFRGLDAEVINGHIVMTGVKLLVQIAHDQIKTVDKSNNVSKREYEQVEAEQ